MRVLVACEEWGRVRDAFAARGHDAWSCDIKPTRAPGNHYECDVRRVLDKQWDLLIAHPVCRVLTNAGVRWLHERPERWTELKPAADFYNLFVDADHIPKRCIENPIMHRYARELVHQVGDLQYVQPWELGEPYTKRTGLRLINLPRLRKTHSKCDYPEILAECHMMPPGPERESMRSRTYPCVANAMARDWGADA